MKKAIIILILSYISIGIYGQNSIKDKLDNIFNKSSTTTEATIIDKNPVGPANENCDCVPYYLCNKNNSIITNGLGLIDIREQGDCSSYLDVCCNPPDKTEKPIYPPTEPKNGCGYRNIDGVGFRITGDNNNEAQFGEFPWMAAILAEEFNAGTERILNVYKCGGAVVHPSVVITAAHCVASHEKKYKVRAGEWDTQTTKELFPHQDRLIKNIVIHKDYSSGTLFNDVAILFLDKPLEIAENVNTLCLPEQNVEIKPGTRCFASGWGKDVFGKEGKYQVILKKLDLPYVDHGTCQNKLRITRLGKYFELDESFVCAGGEEGKDTCKGDGGSPLVCPIPGHENRYQHVGMVAWGVGCAEYNVPGVYVNVGKFRHWIDEQMSLHGMDISYYKV